MKREEKNALSRQRVFDAVMREFSEKGYDADSPEQALGEHEERRHRQLEILLYGVLDK